MSRYTAPGRPQVAEGWRLDRLTPPSRLFGANGLRTGADGRIYVAQVVGSQIIAIHPDTGEIEVISPMGGDIIGPDDLAFDPAGNLFVTEFTEGRVSMLAPNGMATVVHGNMPGANPITVHQGRVFAGECRPDARIIELDRSGSAHRVVLEGIPMANAMEVGPDGKLYFPVMGTNEIWRIDLEGGVPEIVAGNLGVPDSVKFDAQGFIVSTQVATGQVLRIDPRTGNREVLADVAPGLDNVTFVGDRIFVSRFTGEITEILPDRATKPLVASGLNWPLGLATDQHGLLYVADGGFLYTLSHDGELAVAGMLFSPGFPGYFRTLAASGLGEIVVATASGGIARYRPDRCECDLLVEGLDRPNGVAVGTDGAIRVAEGGRGRLLSVSAGQIEEIATGLRNPMSVAIAADGKCFVSEAEGGRVVAISGSGVETLIDGLDTPHGILLRNKRLYVVDAGAKAIIECDIETGSRRTLATELPVGAPAGVHPRPLRGIPPMSGPMAPFTGIAGSADGTLYISGDADGSVLALRPV